MVKWFLVRHGETTWNAEGRVQGHLDSPLTEAGRADAERMAGRLRSVSFDSVCSSDLGRAQATLAAITNGRTLPVQALPGLREKCYGTWEGVTFEEIRERHPEEFDRLFMDDVEFAPPGGESDCDLVRRIGDLVEQLKLTHADDQDILLVGHGGSLRAVLVNLLDLPVRSLWHFRMDNGGLSILGASSNGATVQLWNDTSHLRDVGEDKRP